MSTQTLNTMPNVAGNAAEVRRVDVAAPVQWLGAGVRSFATAPGLSLIYGALFALVAAGTLYLSWTFPGFTVAFITGLLLIGPPPGGRPLRRRSAAAGG
jgi:uncharacterized membrane protein